MIRNNIFLRLRVIRATGLGTTLLNFLVQRVFRVNSQLRHGIHFTSRIIGDRIAYYSDKPTLTSFASAGGLYIQTLNGVSFGRNLLLAPGVRIMSANHSLTQRREPVASQPIEIGHNVWIGANAIILPGVKIADNCVVGAGAVVTKSVEAPGSVVAGNPAKLIRKLELGEL